MEAEDLTTSIPTAPEEVPKLNVPALSNVAFNTLLVVNSILLDPLFSATLFALVAS